MKKTVSLLDSVYFKRDFITRNTLDSPLEKKTVQRLSSLKSTMTILRIWKVRLETWWIALNQLNLLPRILFTMTFEYFTVVNVYVSEKKKFGLMIVVFL